MISYQDRLDIANVIAMHGHLTDAGALHRYDEVFTADVVYDVTALGFGTLEGIDQLIAAARAVGEANPLGHHVTNIVVSDSDIEGGVSVLSKGIGVDTGGSCSTVVYEDTVVRGSDGWRIRYRKVVPRLTPLGGFLD